jgi:hypothetical protein
MINNQPIHRGVTSSGPGLLGVCAPICAQPSSVGRIGLDTIPVGAPRQFNNAETTLPDQGYQMAGLRSTDELRLHASTP